MTDPAKRPETVRWGILGPGRIARKFAAGLQAARGAELVAVGSRDLSRARTFASEFSAARAHGSYEALAADAGVDAVYIGTPHTGHEAHTILCLQAGKHVLCEKPLAVNAEQAARMIAVAREQRLALMEAVWTRFLPAFVRIRELVADGAVGDIRQIQADFGFRAQFDPHSRLFAPELGGGALLDLGIYPLNLAWMFGGAPSEFYSTANLAPTGVDQEVGILLRHAAGAVSVLSCALTVDTPREAHLLGTAGRLHIRQPWWGASRFVLQRQTAAAEEFAFDNRGHGYTDEAEAFMGLIRRGELESAIMPLDESLAILQLMDALRAQWGVRYPGE